MTPEQTATIMIKAKSCFQKWDEIDKQEFAVKIQEWHEHLEDVPYEYVKSAMDNCINHSPYPPSLYEIRKQWEEHCEMCKINKKETIEIYRRAIQHYPCYEDTKETQREYVRIIGKVPVPEKGLKFERDLLAFVRQHEINKTEMPPLIEYMKGVKAIE